MMGWCPRCYIPSFMEIGPPVPEKIFEGFLPYTALSPIGRIKILTYLIWRFLGEAIFDCIIRSCDLFYWFIQTCLGPTVVPTAITSLELFCVLTMCYFSDNVSSKENTKYYGLYLCFTIVTLSL